jgi:hypothetical protein
VRNRHFSFKNAFYHFFLGQIIDAVFVPFYVPSINNNGKAKDARFFSCVVTQWPHPKEANQRLPTLTHGTIFDGKFGIIKPIRKA